MNATPIQLRGLTRHVGSKAILDNLDWTVRQGQVIGWLLTGLAHPVTPLMVLAALGPLGAVAARAMLPRGGERHWEMVAALVLVLRDHARAPRYHMFVVWMAAVALSLVGPLVGVLLAWIIGVPYGPTATIVALMVAAILVRRGLAAATAAPCALPAGQLD